MELGLRVKGDGSATRYETVLEKKNIFLKTFLRVKLIVFGKIG